MGSWDVFSLTTLIHSTFTWSISFWRMFESIRQVRLTQRSSVWPLYDSENTVPACRLSGRWILVYWLFFHLYRLLLYLCVKQTMKTSASPAVTALLAVSVSPCWRNILQKTVKVSISLTFFIHCMASNISEHHVGLIQKTAFTISPFDQSPKLVQPANILRTTSTLFRCCSWLCIPTLATVPLFGIHSKNISFILLWIYHNEL